MSEAYTPGHTRNASDFMAKRTFKTHGQFFTAYLGEGLSVLDCGCGPGSITLGIAACCAPGEVIGIDFGQSQIEKAAQIVHRAGARNVRFKTASCYTLPFVDASFDRVFSHALFEHLTDPARALREFYRVLKPGGIAGVCSPDWGGFLLAPPSAPLSRAVEAYTTLQASNGGDVNIGRKLGSYLTEAGFGAVRMSARYECYPSLALIGDYLALQLKREGDAESAAALRCWSRSQAGLFAQAWVSAIAEKPKNPS